MHRILRYLLLLVMGGLTVLVVHGQSFTKIVLTDGGRSIGSNWIDIDGDDDLDLFVANGNQNNALFRNEADGTFTKITEGAIVNDGGNAIGASWGDYDNDGHLDLFVANFLGPNNFLCTNNGDGTFTSSFAALVSNESKPSIRRGRKGDFLWIEDQRSRIVYFSSALCHRLSSILILFLPSGGDPRVLCAPGVCFVSDDRSPGSACVANLRRSRCRSRARRSGRGWRRSACCRTR